MIKIDTVGEIKIYLSYFLLIYIIKLKIILKYIIINKNRRKKMINYKNEISKIISESINGVEILPEYIEIPKYANNGDFAFPCFRLAKELKKSPIAIAEEIK